MSGQTVAIFFCISMQDIELLQHDMPVSFNELQGKNDGRKTTYYTGVGAR